MNNKQNISELIPENRRYNKDYQPPPQEFYLTIADENILSMDGFCVFSGLPKQGKSLYLSATVASYFLNESIFKIRLRLPKNKPKIVLIDTECSVYNFYKNINNIKHFAQNSFDYKRFDAFRFRGTSPGEIKIFIEQYLKDNKDCGCIVIDGFKQLVKDFNNITECSEFTTFIKRITDELNVMIIGALHTNRGGESTTGHLGASCDEASNATVLIKKNKEHKTMELHPVWMRDAVNDFDVISIKYFDGAGFLLVDTENPVKKRTYKEWTNLEHRSLAAKICVEAGLVYSQMWNDIKEKQAIGTNAAKDILKIWYDENIVYKRDNLYFYDTAK